MGRSATPGDTCIIEGCTEPRDNDPVQRRRICRKHANEERRAYRRRQQELMHPRIDIEAVYAAWGKALDVGKVYHEGQRIIGLKRVGTYFVATFDSLTSAPLASDALLSIG